VPGGRWLERGDELSAIAEAVDAASAGEGRVMIVDEELMSAMITAPPVD
jgi:hypothetical protein